MARRLRKSISEIAQLVDCSLPAVFSIYAKCVNDNENSSRRQAIRCARARKEHTVERIVFDMELCIMRPPHGWTTVDQALLAATPKEGSTTLRPDLK
ncbi:hypothetical protein TNCV_1911091 [Trichonephila clavipes]|nr:hypothetical protein TNCV_1911091 [Trichonephila clavipes]